jgi:quinoprotein glucose dehydrogenase
MGQWAPAAADPELGLFYFVTNASTIEAYTGHRPGNNLFGGSVIALDARTGERRWHFQIHHSDRWNYDLPAAPILLDINVPGRGEIPALIQNTKQGLVFAFNRETGEPICRSRSARFLRRRFRETGRRPHSPSRRYRRRWIRSRSTG